MYKSWYRCLSIFLLARYFFNNLRSTLCLLIHKTLTGILAFAVPFLLPGPECLPFLRASWRSLTRALEWTATGFPMIKPSLINFLTCWRELALAISFASFGSSQILFLPHFRMTEASRFCNLRELWNGTRVLEYLCYYISQEVRYDKLDRFCGLDPLARELSVCDLYLMLNVVLEVAWNQLSDEINDLREEYLLSALASEASEISIV